MGLDCVKRGTQVGHRGIIWVPSAQDSAIVCGQQDGAVHECCVLDETLLLKLADEARDAVAEEFAGLLLAMQAEQSHFYTSRLLVFSYWWV